MQEEKNPYRIVAFPAQGSPAGIMQTTGCVLLFCDAGQAVVSVNFKRRSLRKGDVAVIFPDTVLMFHRASAAFSAWFAEVSQELADEATLTMSPPFWDRLYENPILTPTPPHCRLLAAWEEQLRWMVQLPVQPSAVTMVRNHLQNFFIGLEREVLAGLPKPSDEPLTTTRRLFNRFCGLLVAHCRTQHDVRFYADRLCITPYYLSKVTRKAFGASPKELIDRQIVTEIKMILTTTGLSVKEIADLFRFENPSYLTRYFRRHTGQTPNAYRNSSESAD